MNVSRLVPEAQPIAAAAGEVYLRHTQPWFIGLVAHGSAIKGGFIANCSDIDLQLYLDPGALTDLPPRGAQPAGAESCCPRHGICSRRQVIRVALYPSVTVASKGG
jgi:hypothetical protein